MSDETFVPDPGWSIYNFLEAMFPQHAYGYRPDATPITLDAGPMPYVVIEEGRDDVDTKLMGNSELRDTFTTVYLFSTADLEESIKLYYYICKAKDFVRAHPGVDKVIRLFVASGSARPIFRDDLKRYYAVIRFRVNYLSV